MTGFPLDPDGAAPALPRVLSEADVVGLASSVRTAREVVLATHVLIRRLITGAGMRAVFIEGSDPVGAALAAYVASGDGDPVTLLGSAQSFLRMRDAVDVVRWLRRWNVTHPDDPVALVHDPSPLPPLTTLAEVEVRLAERNLAWFARTGQRIVHWGGTAHVVAGDPRTVHPAGETHRNAGGAMRAALGRRYAVVAITVGAGVAGIPVGIPAGQLAAADAQGFPVAGPAPDFAEARFAADDSPALLVEVSAADEWARRPLRTRMIGPRYDPAANGDYRVDAPASLADCVDVLVHLPRVTPVAPLA